MDDRLASDLQSLRIDRNEGRRSSGRSRRGLVWLGVVAVAGALGFAAWRVASPMVTASLFKTEVGVTEIALISPSQAQAQLTSTGYVVPQNQVDISAKLVGRVDQTNVHEGSKVTAGQVLFVLDASDQRTQIASAQARVSALSDRLSKRRASSCSSASRPASGSARFP